MYKLLSVLVAASLLSACSGRIDGRNAVEPRVAEVARPAPAPDNYVWARNDGRRMSDNPTLYRQGEADQTRCRNSATVAGNLNFQAFASCMEASGYSRRPV